MPEEQKKPMSIFNNVGSIPIRWNTVPEPEPPPKVVFPILKLEIDLNKLLREQASETETKKQEE